MAGNQFGGTAASGIGRDAAPKDAVGASDPSAEMMRLALVHKSAGGCGAAAIAAL